MKSTEYHLKPIVSTVKLTFEEMSTVLTQIEACLNSRPLVPLICDEDGFEALTPGHFLIGRSLDSLPDHFVSYHSIPFLRRCIYVKILFNILAKVVYRISLHSQ